MASTNAITYVYRVGDKVIEVTRRHVKTAYAKNGNVGNPTEYFVWDAAIDGNVVCTAGSRSDAYELALGNGVWNGFAYVGSRDKVRNFRLVKEEMRENYVGKK